MKICKIEWCSRKGFGTDVLCNAHYKRKQLGTDLDKPFQQINKGKICKVRGCNRSSRKKLFCEKHYRALRRSEYRTGIKDHIIPIDYPSTVDPLINKFLSRRF